VAKNLRPFSSVLLSIPPLGEAEEQTKMTEKTAKEKTANSISIPRQYQPRNAADYLYQGATIIAALLIILSATV
jgi:hypothetical protein